MINISMCNPPEVSASEWLHHPQTKWNKGCILYTKKVHLRILCKCTTYAKNLGWLKQIKIIRNAHMGAVFGTWNSLLSLEAVCLIQAHRTKSGNWSWQQHVSHCLGKGIIPKTSGTHQVFRTAEICWIDWEQVPSPWLTAHTEHKFVEGAAVRFREQGLETEETIV